MDVPKQSSGDATSWKAYLYGRGAVGMSYTPGLWLFMLAGLAIAIQIVATWKTRRSAAQRAFLSLMVCIFVWTVAYVLELAAQSLELMVFFTRCQFVGIAFAPVAWLYFVSSYVGVRRPKRYWMLLSAIPVVTNAIVWLAPFPNWFWRQPRLIHGVASHPLVDYSYGVWFSAIHAPYGYLLLLTGLVWLIRTLVRAHPVYRRQTGPIVVAILLPMLSDVVYVLGYSPIPHYNYTPAVFSLSCVIIAWALYRHRFLDLLPMARDTVIEHMDEGVIVLDHQDRLVDFNPAARKVCGFGSADVGAKIEEVSPAFLLRLLPRLRESASKRMEAKLTNGEEHVYDVRLSAIKDRIGQVQGSVVTLRDVTEQHSLFEQMQEMATRDSMTGLLNRNHLLAFGDQEVNRLKGRADGALCVVVMDMDNLKGINDTHGHAVGDQALIALVTSCQDALRTYDIVGRLGGDEFVMILPDTTLADGTGVVERLRRRIEQICIRVGTDELFLSASLGIASAEEMGHHDFGFSDLLARADEAMYQKKRDGRRRGDVAQ